MGIFRITDFGARADGKTVNTDAIQNAIDTCHKNGGGRVVCEGGVFVSGTLELKSNVNFVVESGSIIKGSENLNDYKDLQAAGFNPLEGIEKSKNALILAKFAENISITGMGKIDGSGPAFYDHKTLDTNGKFAKPETPRPRIIMLYRCKNVLIQDLSLIDSSCWTIWLMQCENVSIHRVKFSGDRRMRNNDGIDIDQCKNVTVSDCIFDTEDDCIAVRSMKNLYEKQMVCEDIAVTNCILKTNCNGIRIGCPSDGEIKNCVFSNIVIENCINGILFEYPLRYLFGGSGGASVHDILFDNVIIKDSTGSAVKLIVEDDIKLERLSGISFSNIKILNSHKPIIVCGSSQTTVRNIRFDGVEIRTTGEHAILFQKCEGVKLNNVEVFQLPVIT
ncbi:MAG: glycosyl hydrolase family 28 protein [Candidatus Omnitrophica bacterium]|nr:glycosyl hydrolase family 28 protein [Candidatus Omnitrophota bacterium]